MSKFFYTIAGSADGNQAITVMCDGKVYVASSDRKDFNTIVDMARAGDDDVVDMFEPTTTVQKKFLRLTNRVTVSNGHVLFDNDRVPDEIESAIVRALNSSEEDWAPLVRFMEKLYANPNEHSRTQFYRWLTTHDFTICDDGDIIGYKAVMPDTLLSVHSGRAVVNGVPFVGRIPNQPHSVIEMPRSEVTHDPYLGCDAGLHVGTFDYARRFLVGGAILAIKFSPTDVVSVPEDSSHAKVRVCRYRVLSLVDKPFDDFFVWDYTEDSDQAYEILDRVDSSELREALG